jgi:transglutaminase-like putative cysteine protease
VDEYLQPTYFLDSDADAVKDLAGAITAGKATDVDKAVALFYWVRDEIRYDVYSLSEDPADYRASAVIEKRVGWCVPKAVLLAALARAAGVSSRLHFADIRNHQISEKLLQVMQTDLFFYHGFTEMHLQGAWVKATPAFNAELCHKMAHKTVEFDGISHGMLPETTLNNEKHVEYVKDRGTAPDLPLEEIMGYFKKAYPTP